MNRGLSWAAAGQTLTFTFLKQAQNTSNRGILGCERLERLSRDLLGLNFCLEENREESQGSVRASPSPAIHQPHWGGGEADSSSLFSSTAQRQAPPGG